VLSAGDAIGRRYTGRANLAETLNVPTPTTDVSVK
jgi:hypothetical protein